jgi:hypothetical protein
MKHLRRVLLGIGQALTAFGSAPPYRYHNASDQTRDFAALDADMRVVCKDMQKSAFVIGTKRKTPTK